MEDRCGGLPGDGEALFRAFEQRGGDRSGLGLSICRKNMEAAGGDITVRDLPGVGCVFTVDVSAVCAAPGD